MNHNPAKRAEFRIKRAYFAPAPEDGMRVLVDRLWPRGLSRERAQIDLWAKQLAPSTDLRKWFNHDPGKWDEFKARYLAEIENQNQAIEGLLDFASGTVTLIFGAKEERYNHAVILLELLRERSLHR